MLGRIEVAAVAAEKLSPHRKVLRKAQQLVGRLVGLDDGARLVADDDAEGQVVEDARRLWTGLVHAR